MGRIRGDLVERSFDFVTAVSGLTDRLRSSSKARHVADQLLRAATSVGANIVEADLAESTKDFRHRCAMARLEAGEAHFWLRLVYRERLLPEEETARHMAEADAIRRILSAICIACSR